MDFYVILGLGQAASESDIKRAYRRLARRFHPDINPGDRAAEERFRQIVAAYETLIDPQRRQRYDAGEHGAPNDRGRRSGFEGFDFSARGADHSATFGDLFAEVLTERGDRAPGPVSERGADLHAEIGISLDEAFRGTTRVLVVTRSEMCAVCSGTGLLRTAAARCQMCRGEGALQTVRGHMIFSRSCTSCGGTGVQRPRACGACGGTAYETRTEHVAVPVPAGLADGDRVRVAGKGHAGRRGGEAGDLQVSVRVASHPLFRRDGDDLHVAVPVAIHEAALGARIEVPTPDGMRTVRIPAGTQSGQRFRMRGRGMPSPRTGLTGDVIVEVRLMLPPALDERSRELLQEFGRINGESVRRQFYADAHVEDAAGARNAS